MFNRLPVTGRVSATKVAYNPARRRLKNEDIFQSKMASGAVRDSATHRRRGVTMTFESPHKCHACIFLLRLRGGGMNFC